MIQRIQTIYLLIVVILLSITLLTPFAYFMGNGEQFILYVYALKSDSGEVVFPTLYAAVLPVLSLILPLVTLFLYKRRMLQVRLCVVEMILLVGSISIMAIHYFLSDRLFSELVYSSQGLKVSFALPFIALIFAWLAVRAIFKDELLIRSLDRIR